MLNLSNKRSAPIPALSQKGSSAKIQPAPAAARFILRGEGTTGPVGAAFGLAIPTQPCRANSNGNRTALWLGPDEWLLLAPESETAAVQLEVSAVLATLSGALVDISHRQTALLLSGPGAARALNTGVPLDLSLTAFPVGIAVRTIFEKAEIVLWRVNADSFHIEVWRSFAPYVTALLHAAISE